MAKLSLNQRKKLALANRVIAGKNVEPNKKNNISLEEAYRIRDRMERVMKA